MTSLETSISVLNEKELRRMKELIDKAINEYDVKREKARTDLQNAIVKYVVDSGAVKFCVGEHSFFLVRKDEVDKFEIHPL